MNYNKPRFAIVDKQLLAYIPLGKTKGATIYPLTWELYEPINIRSREMALYDFADHLSTQRGENLLRDLAKAGV